MHLALQQVFKIIMSSDSTFYELYSDIYFAKVLSLAMSIRTIFRKTLLKVYSTLKTKAFHLSIKRPYIDLTIRLPFIGIEKKSLAFSVPVCSLIMTRLLARKLTLSQT